VARCVVADLSPDAVDTLRSLRLRALADCADAFLAEGEHGWDDAGWRLAGSRASWFVAVVDDVPVGLGKIATYPGEPVHLEAMWVDPAQRGRGVGRALARHAEGVARRLGSDMLGLWVFDGNDQARRLYEALGYRPSGRRQVIGRSGGDPADDRVEVELTKVLSPSGS
jgi:GNAT superfamily N-acetyltransferase